MLCKHCGNIVPDEGGICPNCGKPVKKEPPTGAKALLAVLSVLLCMLLTLSLLNTALILDYRQVTSKSSIEKAVEQLLSAPGRIRRNLPLNAAAGAMATEEPEGQTPEALAEWLYSSLKEQYGDEIAITPEQVQSFVAKSSIGNYMKGKIVSYANDFINGTRNTSITSEELRALIEENAPLIESELGIAMDDAAFDAVVGYVEEMELGEVIRTEVIDILENLTIAADGTAPSDELSSAQGGYTLGELMADLRGYTSNTALVVSIVVNVLLIAVLFFTNRMRIPGTLVCAGVPMVIVGGLLSLPTAILQLAMSGSIDTAARTVSTLVGAIAPVHYILLALGVVLIIAAIVTKAALKKR